ARLGILRIERSGILPYYPGRPDARLQSGVCADPGLRVAGGVASLPWLGLLLFPQRTARPSGTMPKIRFPDQFRITLAAERRQFGVGAGARQASAGAGRDTGHD